MSRSNEEQHMRALFTELRREDAGSAPTYAATMAAARRKERVRGHPERRWLFGAAAVPVAAGAALAIWLAIAPESPAPSKRMDVAFTLDEELIVDWSSATDDLLEMPGGDLLGTVPSLGDDGFGIEFPEDPNPGADAAATGFTRRYA